MSKHHNSDFNWNEHEAINSSQCVDIHKLLKTPSTPSNRSKLQMLVETELSTHRLMHNQLNQPVSLIHNIKEAIWFIVAMILLTSPLWIQATGFIKG